MIWRVPLLTATANFLAEAANILSGPITPAQSGIGLRGGKSAGSGQPSA